MKRTITFKDEPYQIIKKYCDDRDVKIGRFAEKVLINYINQQNKSL